MVINPPVELHFLSWLLKRSLKIKQPPSSGIQTGPSANFMPLARFTSFASGGTILLNSVLSLISTSPAAKPASWPNNSAIAREVLVFISVEQVHEFLWV